MISVSGQTTFTPNEIFEILKSVANENKAILERKESNRFTISGRGGFIPVTTWAITVKVEAQSDTSFVTLTVLDVGNRQKGEQLCEYIESKINFDRWG